VIPSNPEEATASGCRVQGIKNGSSLGGLLGAIPGGVNPNDFVQPDSEGNIELVLLNHLAGWMAGATGNDAGEIDAQFFTGDQVSAREFSISESALDADGNPIISFPGTQIVDGLIKTQPSNFLVDVPLLPGVPLRLSLSQAQIEGDVSLDDVGFNLGNGILGGYLTRDAIVELVDTIGAACEGDTPPDFCDTLAGFGGAAGILPLLEGVAPYDSTVSGDDVSACSELGAADCNALSVCILIEMQSATIVP
jgi:hypothetical protein